MSLRSGAVCTAASCTPSNISFIRSARTKAWFLRVARTSEDNNGTLVPMLLAMAVDPPPLGVVGISPAKAVTLARNASAGPINIFNALCLSPLHACFSTASRSFFASVSFSCMPGRPSRASCRMLLAESNRINARAFVAKCVSAC